MRWSISSLLEREALLAPFHAAIEIEEYQLEPVARVLTMPRANLLIANDVGLGKTIEAGLVIQEMLARKRVRRILIVCPASLQQQWKDEMQDKFQLELAILRMTHMNKWHDLQLEDRLTEILCEFCFDEKHHFGRPFASSYQIAIAFAGRFPDVFEQIGLPLGGPGTGKHYTFTQYLAGELSRRIKSGEITHIEGAWFSTLRLHGFEFDFQDDLLTVPTPQEVISMFRLTEQGVRTLDHQRYDEAVAAGRRDRMVSKSRRQIKVETQEGGDEGGACVEQLELF